MTSFATIATVAVTPTSSAATMTTGLTVFDLSGRPTSALTLHASGADFLPIGITNTSAAPLSASGTLVSLHLPTSVRVLSMTAFDQSTRRRLHGGWQRSDQLGAPSWKFHGSGSPTVAARRSLLVIVGLTNSLTSTARIGSLGVTASLPSLTPASTDLATALTGTNTPAVTLVRQGGDIVAPGSTAAVQYRAVNHSAFSVGGSGAAAISVSAPLPTSGLVEWHDDSLDWTCVGQPTAAPTCSYERSLASGATSSPLTLTYVLHGAANAQWTWKTSLEVPTDTGLVARSAYTQHAFAGRAPSPDLRVGVNLVGPQETLRGSLRSFDVTIGSNTPLAAGLVEHVITPKGSTLLASRQAGWVCPTGTGTVRCTHRGPLLNAADFSQRLQLAFSAAAPLGLSLVGVEVATPTTRAHAANVALFNVVAATSSVPQRPPTTGTLLAAPSGTTVDFTALGARVTWIRRGQPAGTISTATAEPGHEQCRSLGNSCTIAGLTPGSLYAFTVTSVAGTKTSPASPVIVRRVPTPSAAPSGPAPTNAPATPAGLTVTATNTAVGTSPSLIRTVVQASWLLSAPAGTDAVTSYYVTDGAGHSCSVPQPTLIAGQSTPTRAGCTLSGFSPGSSSSFAVTATNAAGTSSPSSSVPFTMPALLLPTAPGAPRASVSGADVTFTWSAPTTSGNDPITAYVLDDGAGHRCRTAATTCTVTGLPRGTAATFTVVATTVAGTGAPSAPTTVHIAAATAPTAPTKFTVKATPGAVTASWAAPVSGGTDGVTSYLVTIAGATCTVPATKLTCTVTGLYGPRTVTATVVAQSAAGTSPTASAVVALPKPVLPKAPQRVQATATADSTVLFSWVAPASLGSAPLRHYLVTDGKGHSCTTTTTSCVVQSLTPSTAYVFRVSAVTAAGVSPPSPAVSVRTPRPSAPSAPRGIHVSILSTTAVLTWSAPASSGDRPITSYTARDGKGQSCVAAATDSGPLTCSILNLSYATSYTFTVVATSAVGTSVPSSPVVASTPTATVPSAPTTLVLTRSGFSVAATWVAPVSAGSYPITSYTVTDGAGHQCTIADLTLLSCTLSSLPPGQSSTLTVYATSAAGNSAPSVPASVSLPALALPSAPLGLAIVQTGPSAVTASWDPPASTGDAPISSYTVTDDHGHRCVVASTAPRSCVITNLPVATQLTFSVIATSAAGNSAAASAVALTLPSPVVPGSPTNVRAVRSGSTVTVSWSAPATHGSAPISNYLVSNGVGGSCSTVDGSATSCVFSNLPGHLYSFSVTARSVAGSSVPSPAVNLNVPNLPFTPTKVTAVNDGGNLRVSWSAPTNATSSGLTRYLVRDGVGDQCVALAPALTCVVQGLAADTTYSFTVVAIGPGGSSLPSAAATATTGDPAVPSAPTSLGVSPALDSFGLSWGAPVFWGYSPVVGVVVTVYAAAGGVNSTPLWTYSEPLTGANSVDYVTAAGLDLGCQTDLVATVQVGNSSGLSPSSPASNRFRLNCPIAPSAPTATFVPGNGSVTMSFAYGTIGVPILDTTISITDQTTGQFVPSLDAPSLGNFPFTPVAVQQIYGLTNGDRYAFTVTVTTDDHEQATREIDYTLPALDSPAAPTSIHLSPGTGKVVVSWSEPTSSSPFPVVGFTVSDGRGDTCSTPDGATHSCQLTGLQSGVSYSIVVTAISSNGNSTDSSVVAFHFTTLSTPSAPTGLTLDSGNGQITASWTAPTWFGVPVLTSYLVSDGHGHSCLATAPATTCTITGLSNGTAYTFTVVAQNSQGASPASPAVTSVPASTPAGQVVHLSTLTLGPLTLTTISAALSNDLVTFSGTATAALGVFSFPVRFSYTDPGNWSVTSTSSTTTGGLGEIEGALSGSIQLQTQLTLAANYVGLSGLVITSATYLPGSGDGGSGPVFTVAAQIAGFSLPLSFTYLDASDWSLSATADSVLSLAGQQVPLSGTITASSGGVFGSLTGSLVNDQLPGGLTLNGAVTIGALVDDTGQPITAAVTVGSGPLAFSAEGVFTDAADWQLIGNGSLVIEGTTLPVGGVLEASGGVLSGSLFASTGGPLDLTSGAGIGVDGPLVLGIVGGVTAITCSVTISLGNYQMRGNLVLTDDQDWTLSVGGSTLTLGPITLRLSGTLADAAGTISGAITAATDQPATIAPDVTISGSLGFSYPASPTLSGDLTVTVSSVFTFEVVASFTDAANWSLTVDGATPSKLSLPGFGAGTSFAFSGAITDAAGVITYAVAATVTNLKIGTAVTIPTLTVTLSNSCPTDGTTKASLCGADQATGVFLSLAGTVVVKNFATATLEGFIALDQGKPEFLLLARLGSNFGITANGNGVKFPLTLSNATFLIEENDPGASVLGGGVAISFKGASLLSGAIQMQVGGTATMSFGALGSITVPVGLEVNVDANGGVALLGGASFANVNFPVPGLTINGFAFMTRDLGGAVTFTIGGATFTEQTGFVGLAGTYTLPSWMTSELNLGSSPSVAATVLIGTAGTFTVTATFSNFTWTPSLPGGFGLVLQPLTFTISNTGGLTVTAAETGTLTVPSQYGSTHAIDIALSVSFVASTQTLSLTIAGAGSNGTDLWDDLFGIHGLNLGSFGISVGLQLDTAVPSFALAGSILLPQSLTQYLGIKTTNASGEIPVQFGINISDAAPCLNLLIGTPKNPANLSLLGGAITAQYADLSVAPEQACTLPSTSGNLTVAQGANLDFAGTFLGVGVQVQASFSDSSAGLVIDTTVTVDGFSVAGFTVDQASFHLHLDTTTSPVTYDCEFSGGITFDANGDRVAVSGKIQTGGLFDLSGNLTVNLAGFNVNMLIHAARTQNSDQSYTTSVSGTASLSVLGSNLVLTGAYTNANGVISTALTGDFDFAPGGFDLGTLHFTFVQQGSNISLSASASVNLGGVLTGSIAGSISVGTAGFNFSLSGGLALSVGYIAGAGANFAISASNSHVSASFSAYISFGSSTYSTGNLTLSASWGFSYHGSGSIAVSYESTSDGFGIRAYFSGQGHLDLQVPGSGMSFSANVSVGFAIEAAGSWGPDLSIGASVNSDGTFCISAFGYDVCV